MVSGISILALKDTQHALEDLVSPLPEQKCCYHPYQSGFSRIADQWEMQTQ